MYQRRKSTQLQGLGFSLKPPSWARNAIRSVVSDTVNAATKAARDAASAAARDAAQRLQTPPRSPVDQVNDAVAAVPGGWLTIIGIGLGALALLKPPHRS